MFAGGTAIAKALQLSGKEFFVLNDNPGQPRRVFLVTDGYETAGGFPVAVASYLKQIKGKGF